MLLGIQPGSRPYRLLREVQQLAEAEVAREGADSGVAFAIAAAALPSAVVVIVTVTTPLAPLGAAALFPVGAGMLWGSGALARRGKRWGNVRDKASALLRGSR